MAKCRLQESSISEIIIHQRKSKPHRFTHLTRGVTGSRGLEPEKTNCARLTQRCRYTAFSSST